MSASVNLINCRNSLPRFVAEVVKEHKLTNESSNKFNERIIYEHESESKLFARINTRALCGYYVWWRRPELSAKNLWRIRHVLWRKLVSTTRLDCKIWWRRGELNARPPACKADALPTELRPPKVVGPSGFEPLTPVLSGLCSNQLSYGPEFTVHIIYYPCCTVPQNTSVQNAGINSAK